MRLHPRRREREQSRASLRFTYRPLRLMMRIERPSALILVLWLLYSKVANGKEPTWRKKVDVACRRQVEWQKGEMVPGTQNDMKIFVNSMFVICKYKYILCIVLMRSEHNN